LDCAQHNAEIERHFDSIAADYPKLQGKNPYYHGFLERWCRALVPAGRRVLEVGCGRGELLAALEPRDGHGIDLAGAMIEHARRDHPGLRFTRTSIEDFAPDGSYDAAVCVNTLDYTWDVGAVLDKIHAALRDNGRLLIATANPLWSPIFNFASKIGLRIPESRRLYITLLDLVNLLELHGFEVALERMDLVLPSGSRACRASSTGRCRGLRSCATWARPSSSSRGRSPRSGASTPSRS